MFERYKAYIANAGVYTLATVIPSILTVLINPLMALNMSPEDYAIVSYYTSFNALFAPVVAFFFVDYFIRQYYRLDAASLRILKGSLIKLFLSFSFGVCFLCILGLLVFVRTSHVSFSFFPYAPLAIFPLATALPLSLASAEYKIAGDSKGYFKVSVIWGILGALIPLLFVAFFKMGAEGRLLGSMICSAMSFIWGLYYFRDYLHIKFDYSIGREIFSFAWPLVLAAILNFFSNGYDKVILERQHDPVSMGYYAVGLQMASMIGVFSTAIKSTFQPDMYKAISAKNLKKVAVVALGVILMVSVIVFLFIIFCPIIIKLLTAGRYMQALPYARIMSLYIITSNIYYQISQFTYGIGLSKITLWNKIMGTILTIITLLFLIEHYGAIGASWGMVISYVYFAIGNTLLLYINRHKIFAGES
ncbi:MAG: oligosaccharide flippase family protein [Prevotellaceae bacterium]|nr:oligosaccharide flippase family protein [Candidatus Faecinaster equi]